LYLLAILCATEFELNQPSWIAKIIEIDPCLNWAAAINRLNAATPTRRIADPRGFWVSFFGKDRNTIKY